MLGDFLSCQNNVCPWVVALDPTTCLSPLPGIPPQMNPTTLTTILYELPEPL